MYEEKLEEIRTLSRSIRSKSIVIQDRIKLHKDLNVRLSLFLEALESYSIDEADENTANTSKKSEPSQKSRPLSEGQKIPTSTTIRNVIASIFKLKKPQRDMALMIHDLIEGKGTATLDEIVKEAKRTKYKVIETLNILVKERLIIKHFDKGFIYRINDEYE